MTDVNTNHPYGIPQIELTEKGRKIKFQKDCLEKVAIFRKVDDEEQKLLIEHTSTPFFDLETFPKGTRLSYAIIFTHQQQEKKYDLMVFV